MRRPVKLYNGVPSVRSGSHTTLSMSTSSLSVARWEYRELRRCGVMDSAARRIVVSLLSSGSFSERVES